MRYSLKAKVMISIWLGVFAIGCNEKDRSKIRNEQINRNHHTSKYLNLEASNYTVKDVSLHTKIKIYGINCPNECGVKSLFTKRTDKVKTLTQNEYERLITIVNNPNSYGASTFACYHPSVGIISYNENEKPLSYIGICLTCNNHESNIKLNVGADEKNGYKYGYSPQGRKLLRTFLNDIGFDHSETFSEFDYKDDLKEHLERKEISNLKDKDVTISK